MAILISVESGVNVSLKSAAVLYPVITAKFEPELIVYVIFS